MQHNRNIEDYFNGDLQGEERRVFEELMTQNELLAAEIHQQKMTHEQLHALSLRRKVGETIRLEKQRRRYHLLLRAAAASFALLLGSVWFFHKNTTQPMTDKPVVSAPVNIPLQRDSVAASNTSIPPTGKPSAQTQPLPAPPRRTRQYAALANQFYTAPRQNMVRSTEGTPADSFLQYLNTAVQEKKHTRIISLLPDDTRVADDENLRMLRADAFFQLEQYERAQADFEALNNSFQYRHEARWNVLLCLLARSGNSVEMQKILRGMTTDAQFPFQEKAIRLGQALAR
jgi:hypothetical protein